MSDWPYHDDDSAIISEPNAPEWQCPEGLCECHPTDGKGDKYEFSVMLFSPEGERMAGARCRVLFQGHVLNEDQPNADGSGLVTAVVPHLPASVLVEWAPASTPKGPPYPYRKWYYVDLDRDRDDAVRRRLHNLGYSRFRSLTENVTSFQQDYRYAYTTGKVEDIELDLIAYHDEGQVPHQPLKGGGSGSDDIVASPGGGAKAKPAPGSANLEGVPSPGQTGKPKKQTPAPPPPTKGGTKLGFGAAMFPLKLPNVVDVVGNGQALFEFVRIFSQATTPASKSATSGQTVAGKPIAGFFWILGEALMCEMPKTDEWKDWNVGSSPLPDKPFNYTKTIDRTRLCRLPCNARDSQIAANMIGMKQQDLLDTTTDGMTDQYKPTTTNMESSLLPTTKLYNLLYNKPDAHVKIEYVYVDDMDHRSTANMSNEYNSRVNTAITSAIASAGTSGTVKSVGTPGKIWAVHPDIDIWAQKGNPPPPVPYVAAVNYGFHTKGPPAKAFQGADVWHDLGHADYSQILVVVAGWCLVMGPNDTNYTWQRTADVYQSADLCPLVGTDGKPAPEIVYTGVGRGSKSNPRRSPGA